MDKSSFEALLKAEAQRRKVYVLEEGGKNITEIQLEEDAVFVLGDHVGLPKKAETFALRYGEKISLGKQPYLAASCITIINYLLTANLSLAFKMFPASSVNNVFMSVNIQKQLLISCNFSNR